MRKIDFNDIIFIIFMVISVFTVSYILGLHHGHEANFERCLTTNQHLVYTEAIKTCGGEMK